MLYSAYVKFDGEVFDKKVDKNSPWMIIGKDSEDIIENAKQYGTEPYFVSGMQEMSKDWQ